MFLLKAIPSLLSKQSALEMLVTLGQRVIGFVLAFVGWLVGPTVVYSQVYSVISILRLVLHGILNIFFNG